MELAKFIPWLPLLAAILCGVCCMQKPLRKFAAPLSIGSIVLAFLLSLLAGAHIDEETPAKVLHFFEWIHVGDFKVNFSYYFDSLTLLMLYVVTGIGSLVAIYASGYMKGDRGYARFFVGVSLFIFAMTTLVMADNLVLMFLGWEGVGLCSYLLIGYYYEKPSAVAAAKKAFIVNRIGDLAFVLGIFLTFQEFGTVQFEPLFKALSGMEGEASTAVQWIPFLLMLGAFGKSAQLPLYVWLPDAMEGPTPVSALIHAATMVTAGVYLIVRMFPLFEMSPYALPTVATVGGLTAFFAGCIALCQYDIKRIFAYSTVSQLGYMFLGVGALSTFGGVFHLYTHAFFKALLFLTAGSVMHAMTGQLDLRKMSGLKSKMPVTCWLMFIGCVALAGLPPFAGFFSKDTILADTLAKGLSDGSGLYMFLAVLGLITAFMTAYYTFRLWFRVFCGPTEFEMGDDHHGDDDAHHGLEDDHAHHHEPHEMPWLMNGPLVVLAIGAIFAGLATGGWVQHSVEASSANLLHAGHDHAHDGGHHGPSIMGMDLHLVMMVASTLIAIGGVMLARRYHLVDRPAADILKKQFQPIATVLENKFYVDEFYNAVIVQPLYGLGKFFFIFDRMIIDGVVAIVGFVPRLLGLAIQPTQRGRLQGYGLGMVVGVAILLLFVVIEYWKMTA